MGLYGNAHGIIQGSVCNRILQRMKGEVNLDSNPILKRTTDNEEEEEGEGEEEEEED